MDQNLILLRNHNLFRKLTFKECRQLNIKSGSIKARKKDFIYLNSFSNDKLYFLKSGYIKIGHYDEKGNEVITEILQQGDIFGQISLEKEEKEGEFAQAIKKDASICSFTIEDFEQILEKRPDLAISYTKLVGLKLKRLRNRFWDIIHKDVKTRLIDFLLQLAGNHNLGLSDQLEMENFMTHAEVANLIGSSRQTVTTLINELEQKNLIAFNRQKIQFFSLIALKKESLPE